jgi:hypothetical protein
VGMEVVKGESGQKYDHMAYIGKYLTFLHVIANCNSSCLVLIFTL